MISIEMQQMWDALIDEAKTKCCCDGSERDDPELAELQREFDEINGARTALLEMKIERGHALVKQRETAPPGIEKMKLEQQCDVHAAWVEHYAARLPPRAGPACCRRALHLRVAATIARMRTESVMKEI